jgi:hypothetical protein
VGHRNDWQTAHFGPPLKGGLFQLFEQLHGLGQRFIQTPGKRDANKPPGEHEMPKLGLILHDNGYAFVSEGIWNLGSTAFTKALAIRPTSSKPAMINMVVS